MHQTPGCIGREHPKGMMGERGEELGGRGREGGEEGVVNGLSLGCPSAVHRFCSEVS